MAEDLLEIVQALSRPGRRGMMATLVSVEGSSYRRPGARLVWWDDGRRAGAISGGCLEEDVIAHGQVAADLGKARWLTYQTDADGDPLWGVGTGCDGTLRILVEPLTETPHPLVCCEAAWARGVSVHAFIRAGDEAELRTAVSPLPPSESEDVVFSEELVPPLELWIFGAGDDARPVAALGRELGWRIHVMDTRSALLTASRFPGSHLHLWSSLSTPILPQAWRTPCQVVMSHRFRDDCEALRHFLTVDSSYVGLLGPRRRAERVLGVISSELTAEETKRLQGLRAPIGLHLGGEGSRSVALAIVSEIQSVLCAGEVVPHSQRRKPIHA